MSFGKLLKNLLDDQQMAQAELASAIGYTQRAISKWVNEQAEPSETAIKLVADFFNVSTDYLLGRTDDFGSVIASPTAPILSEEESNLLALFHKMTHAQKVRFMAYGEGMVGIDMPKFNA